MLRYDQFAVLCYVRACACLAGAALSTPQRASSKGKPSLPDQDTPDTASRTPKPRYIYSDGKVGLRFALRFSGVVDLCAHTCCYKNLMILRFFVSIGEQQKHT
jgi:hypothetical protein